MYKLAESVSNQPQKKIYREGMKLEELKNNMEILMLRPVNLRKMMTMRCRIILRICPLVGM